MKFTKQEGNVLKEKITKWYQTCEEDYGISGGYIGSHYDPQTDILTIIFEESHELRYAVINSASFYTINGIYNIWSSPECVWGYLA